MIRREIEEIEVNYEQLEMELLGNGDDERGAGEEKGLW